MAKTMAATGPVKGPWALPAGWRWGQLGSFASKAGKSITPTRTPDDIFQLYSVPSHPFGFPETVVGREIGSAKQSVGVGDVLLCKINPRINRVWKVADHGTGHLIASTEWIRFAANNDVEPDYLRYFLMRHEVRDYLAMNASGVGGSLMRVRPSVVETVPFPLPPTDRQRAIVARIDEMFAEIDDGEAALARARADLATWRKALLKAAVTGELTADWRAANPSVESGEDLVARISAKRRERGEARSTGRREQAFPTLDGAADGRSLLPEGWVWARIGDLFDVFVGATPSRSDSSLWNGDVPWVSSGEVGFCRISDTREKINRAALRGSAGRLHPPGTVMLGMIGEGKTRGQAAILDIEAAHNQNCASIRVGETPIPPEYIYLVLAEQYERTRLSSSGGNQPALNKERVKAIRIPLPGVSECQAIAAIYDEASDAIDAFEAEHVLIHFSIATLQQSILAAAFRGELA